MANQPKQPDEPTPMNGGDHSASPHTEHGIPPDAQSEEPTGLPTSDRHQVETTPTKP